MKTTAVGEHGLQLTRYGLVNCYLVREADGFTLVDTGLAGSEEAILAAAERAGGVIRRILLTHAHVDHVGSVDGLMGRRGGGVEVAASGRTVPLLRQPPDKRLEPGEPEGPVRGGLPGIRAEVTHAVEEGELYGSLRCVATPGHIPGHFAFLDERDGTLYAGDALICVGRLAVSGYAPWYFPLPNVATWNKGVAVESAKRLVGLKIKRFAAGHGVVREGRAAELRGALAQAR